MRITWVTRSFLDYRIPVYAELDRLCEQQLTLIYNGEVVPERCQQKIQAVLGKRAIALNGERRLTGQKNAPVSSIKRRGVRIPWQPGLIQACRDSEPDVCISDGFFQWTYAPLWMRFRYHIPHVMCYEPTKHTERKAQFFRTWYRRLVSRWIDAICCNGSLCEEYCTDILHIPAGKLSAGQMAADTDRLAEECQQLSSEQACALRQRLGLKGIVFLFVGRLVELKGLRQLLQAWKDASLLNASFLCVGGGPLLEKLRVFCVENNIPVHFTGEIDYSNVAQYYRCADVFIIPTLQDNWSLVVPEAMACGLPIACSKYNGCWPELVKPENGWVFDPLDKEQTVKTLETINSLSTSQLQSMGQISTRIVEAYSPDRAAQAIYNACITELEHKRK